MTLDELENIADAVASQLPANLQKQRLAEGTKKVIALCRLQHEALKADPDLREGKTEDALAAYEEFGKTGEEV